MSFSYGNFRFSEGSIKGKLWAPYYYGEFTLKNAPNPSNHPDAPKYYGYDPQGVPFIKVWEKSDKNGKAFYSMMIDLPDQDKVYNLNAFQTDETGCYDVVYSRPRRPDAKPQETEAAA